MIIQSVRALVQDRALYALSPEAKVSDACSLLDQHNIGALAVLKDGALVGILSERDVIRRCIAQGRDTQNTSVSEIMTRDVRVAFVDDSLAEALSVMRESGCRHLPVVDDEGLPIAMLSVRDIPTEYRIMSERYHGYMAEGAPMHDAHMGQL